jgi:hypothetical protein
MDIGSTIVGDMVKFANPAAGLDYDQSLCRTLLNEGNNYQVKKIAVSDWHTDIWLVGCGKEPFNSVMFDNVTVFDDKQEQERRAKAYPELVEALKEVVSSSINDSISPAMLVHLIKRDCEAALRKAGEL